MTNTTVKRSDCPICTGMASRVQQIAQERDGYMLAALEMQDELTTQAAQIVRCRQCRELHRPRTPINLSYARPDMRTPKTGTWPST